MIKITTHNGIFHSDEVTAIALLKVFLDEEIVVDRVNHQTPINELGEYDFVIDLGRKYDGKKYFDHHQDRNIEASNVLIFEYLVENEYITNHIAKELEELMKHISNNDRGIGDKPGTSDITTMISYLNEDDIYSEEQNKAFNKAVELMSNYISKIAKRADKLEETRKKLESCKEIIPNVLDMKEFLPGWNEVIHKIGKFNHIDIVVWEDKQQGNWKAQVVPDEPGSFGRRDRALEPMEISGKIFIHPGKFFAVFKNKESLLNYIKGLRME